MCWLFLCRYLLAILHRKYIVVIRINKYMRDINSNYPVFQKAFLDALPSFRQSFVDLKFSQKTFEEILDFLFREKTKIPSRATSENAKQEQWSYLSSSAYLVVVHTGIIGNQYSDRGNGWVMILDTELSIMKKTNPDFEGSDKVFVRAFNRNVGPGYLYRLLSYAKFAKNIADARLKDTKLGFAIDDDGEISETKMVWQTDFGTDPFHWRHYTKGLSIDEKLIIRRGESSRRRYLEKTKGRVRRKDIRTTWTD
jgi:hypothetical protein